MPGEVDSSDGGYCFDVNVSGGINVVAAFQLHGDMERVIAMGRTVDYVLADRILKHFIQSLIEAPGQVAQCCYTIVNPQWSVSPDCFTPTPGEDSRNEYGWQDGLFLGAQNIQKKVKP